MRFWDGWASPLMTFASGGGWKRRLQYSRRHGKLQTKWASSLSEWFGDQVLLAHEKGAKLSIESWEFRGGRA